MEVDNTAAGKPVVSTLNLTFTHDTFHLDIKGEAPALETFLAMLEQAKRHFEAEIKRQQVLAMQNVIAEQRRGQMLAEKVSRKLI